MKHVKSQSEWEAEMAAKVLDFVRSELYVELRFLSTALSALAPKETAELDAFATDGTSLYFSSRQVLRVFETNARYLDRAYLHTVLHCIFSHLWIAGSRDRSLWGLSCDIAVEYVIDRMGKNCTKRILSWLRQQTYEALEREKSISAAVIYGMVSEMEEERRRDLLREFYTDDHRYWPKQEEERASKQKAAMAKWNKIARQTQMQQQMTGDENGEKENVLTDQLKAVRSKRNYGDFLKKFAVLREELHPDPDEFDMNFYTYGLQLYKNMPLLEPVETREVMKIREFAVVVDTSYSTSGELITNFLKETFGILSDTSRFFEDFRIRIIQCDDQVRMDEEVRTKEELHALLENFTIAGGGGTDFRPAFTYVNDLVKRGVFKNLCGLLYFTDGKGIYPKQKPEYKTAFLFLEDYEENELPPWALRMRLDL